MRSISSCSTYSNPLLRRNELRADHCGPGRETHDELNLLPATGALELDVLTETAELAEWWLCEVLEYALCALEIVV